jgi:hypothetical protein
VLVVGAFFIPHPSSLILAQQQQPAFFEPKEGYYGARGVGVKTEWAVDRTTVPEDGALVATLTVRGAVNPPEVRRPELAKIAAFHDRFQVEDVPGLPPAAKAKEVAFAYKLRPRNRDVIRLPSLDFFYLNPTITNKSPFQNARAAGVDIVVTAAAPKPKPPGVPLEEPDRVFAVETGPAVLAREPFAPGPAAWAGLAAVVILAPLGWYAAWRAVYPDAARLARRRRTRAARRALAAVQAAARTADPAGACAAAVLGYLRERFPLPPGADTPPEVAAGLAAAGVPAGVAEDAVGLLRGCDAARFAPADDTAVSLPAAAAALVARLEAVE